MFVVLAALLTVTVMWVTPALGAAPTITAPFTATISDTADSLMVTDYTVADADGDAIIYNIDPAVPGLSIDASTGLVTASTAQSDGSYTLSITTNADSTPVTQAITYTVFTDAAAPAITGTLTANVAETDAVGTTVGTTITVTDVGDGAFYAISGTGSSDFVIDFFDGTLKVAQALDFETTPSYSLTLTVKDSKQTEVTDTIVLTITDANDAPVCSPASYTPSVAEDAALNDAVVTVTCTDVDAAGDTLTYALVGGNTNADFAIDSSTGAVTVAKLLDFETTPTYTIDAEVEDGTVTSTATITITITNVNEAPVCSPASYTPSVAENAAVNDAVVTVACTDVDVGDTLTYALGAGNTNSDFAIDPSTRAVTVAKLLDFETTQTYTIDAEVDDGTVTSTATITITITDVNDAPVCSPDSYAHTLVELAAVNSPVVTVTCTDVDAPSDTLTYALGAGDTNSDFAIDSSTGAVTTLKGNDGTVTSTATITITITDDKITAPLTSKIATLANSVAIPAYTVTADAGSTYAFDSPVTGLAIDSNTGVVSASAVLTAGSLDYIVVITTSSSVVAKETITNTVFADSADPVIGGSSVLTASVLKSAAVGTTVAITIVVTDTDSDDGFTYEIAGTGSDKFAMDYFSGALTTAASLDSNRYSLDLTVKDSKRTSVTDTIIINVNSANAHMPVFYTKRYKCPLMNEDEHLVSQKMKGFVYGQILVYSLGQLSSSAANNDGTLRKTNKVALARELEKNISPCEDTPSPSAVTIDGMSLVQKLSGSDKIFSQLAESVIASFLHGGSSSNRIDMVFGGWYLCCWT
ncbi:hypothetical protein ScPMuIL_014584 [Solemya velum]